MVCRTVFVLALLAVLTIPSHGCHSAPDLELVHKFQDAQEAFDRAATPDEFLHAATLYQEFREAGIVSGALLYNQGNAFMRAGRTGRAVACYRQAQRFRPRDPYLTANLRYALGTDATRADSRSLMGHLLFWQDWISYPNEFHITAALASITFLLGLIVLYLRRHPYTRLAWIALLLTLIFSGSAAYDWYRYDWVQHGVVTRNGVIARKGNGESYEPAFTEPLDEATEFRVVERRGEWLLIRLSESKEGWVAQNAVVLF